MKPSLKSSNPAWKKITGTTARARKPSISGRYFIDVVQEVLTLKMLQYIIVQTLIQTYSSIYLNAASYIGVLSFKS